MPGITQDEMRVLADAYTRGTDISMAREGQSMARAYADRVQRDFRKLQQKIHVDFTDRDPYTDYEQLLQDVLVNKRMYVFTGFSETPLWTPEVNWMARAVHDYDHVMANTDFSLGGELHAFQVAAARAPQLEPLFLSEIGLQAAVSVLTGAFAEGPQKFVVPTREASLVAQRYRRNDTQAAREASLVWDAAGALKYMTAPELMSVLAEDGIAFGDALALVLAAETTQDLARGETS